MMISGNIPGIQWRNVMRMRAEIKCIIKLFFSLCICKSRYALQFHHTTYSSESYRRNYELINVKRQVKYQIAQRRMLNFKQQVTIVKYQTLSIKRQTSKHQLSNVTCHVSNFNQLP